MSYALWFVQVVLAIVFLSAGGMKLVLPIDMLGMPFQLPAVLCVSSVSAKCWARLG